MRHFAWYALLVLLATAGSAHAASTVRLPASTCPASEAIFWNGFDNDATPHDPSNGSGGSFPGDVTRTINIPSVGTRTYYLHLPPAYTPARAWPLLLTLHGSAPSPPTAAQQVLADWSALADASGFIAISAVGNGAQGGWGTSDDIAELNAVLADAFASYNVERSRVYLWGFSAGAHFGHWLALSNTDVFAAYGVSAGALQLYTCTDSGPPTCAAFLAAVPRKIPLDIHIGNSDPLYASVSTDAMHDAQRLQNGGWVRGRDLYYVVFADGHLYTIAQLGQIWNNLCPFALGP
jgi:poly(3-hydroxybutyrate) depolymerase